MAADPVLVGVVSGVGVAGVTGFFTWLAARQKVQVEAPVQAVAAAAALQEAVNKAAEGVVADLRREIVVLSRRVERSEARVEELERENETCRGENRQMKQRIDSLETVLHRQGIDVKSVLVGGALTVVEGGVVTVTPPRVARTP